MSIRITLHVHWKGDDDEDGGNHDNDDVNENYPPCPLQAPFTCWLTGAPLTMGGVWGYWLGCFGHHHVNHHHHHNNHRQSRGIACQAHHRNHHEDEH